MLDPTLVAVGLGDDTLTKSDKLTVAYVLPSEIAPEPTESLRRQEPGENAKTRSQPLAASHPSRRGVLLPKPRPKIKLAKVSHPPKPVVEVKTCSQPDGLGGLLLSFSGQPHCG